MGAGKVEEGEKTEGELERGEKNQFANYLLRKDYAKLDVEL